MRDAAFEALLGSIVGRLVEAAPDAVNAAFDGVLSELCTGFELAEVGLLQPSTAPPHFALTARGGDPCAGLRQLVESCPAFELQRLLQLANRSAPFVLEPAAREDGLVRIRGELSARSLGALLCAGLELGGLPLGALLLVAADNGSFTSSLLLRLRLMADTFALGLLLRERRHAAGELTDQQMREFERRNLLAVIERCGWRLQGAQGAARALGLSPSTLRDRMRSFGIHRPR